MFAQKFLSNFKTEKKRVKRADLINEQVKQVMKATDQKLILMVRS